MFGNVWLSIYNVVGGGGVWGGGWLTVTKGNVRG